MESRVRVRMGRVLLVAVGVTLLLDAFHVIELPWAFLWPLVLLVGGIAMIRWVARPTQEPPVARPATAVPARAKDRLPVVLRIARVVLGLFVKT